MKDNLKKLIKALGKALKDCDCGKDKKRKRK